MLNLLTRLRWVLPIILCGVAACTWVQAGAQEIDTNTQPMVQEQAGISYVAGGIGQGESTAIRQIAKNYKLRLTFTNKASEFVTPVAVQIRHKKGNTVFSLASTGPLLLVQLPPGSYRISANYDGIEKHMTVNIPKRGGVASTLVWPA